MCELFAMSSAEPATINLSLHELAQHGGGEAPHKDGWGIAYYEQNDVRLLRETSCARNNPWIQFIEQQAMRSTIVISHLRKATEGEIALRNTQPFARELGGRMHVFAHNGHVPTVRDNNSFVIGVNRSIGETDSEYAFCALLERLRSQETGSTDAPDTVCRVAIVTRFARELGDLGLANFIYSDGERLIVHGHRRNQPDGSFRAPGLFLLERKCAGHVERGGGIRVDASDQTVVLVASVPLTNEHWIPLGEGDVVAIADGKVESWDTTETPS